MFASRNRLLMRMSRHLVRRNVLTRSYSTGPNAKSTSSLLLVFLASTIGAAGGYYLCNYNSPLKASDASTTPLNSVAPPQYAGEADFKIALQKFTDIVGKENVTNNKEVIDAHADTFFSTHHPPKPDVQRPGVVIYPANTEQVSEILKVAHKYRVPVVANSGLTSLEGHNMQTRGPNAISLSFENMTDIVAFHPDDLDVVVQAGVGWQDLDLYLQESENGSHLMFGPDPGMGATIGGMVGTSASGTNAYKFGTMKENVVNLTVVLADGTIVKTRQRPRKSSAGYDLTHLFIGSEGTLGIVTEITVKLHPRAAKELVAIAAFPSIKDAAATAQYIITRSGMQPNALELVNDTMMSFVNDSGSVARKFMEMPSLMFKVGGPSDKIIQDQLDFIEKVAKDNHVITFEQSTNAEDNEVLWGARRAGLWSTFEFGKKVLDDKNDVQIWTTDFAVPISKLADIINETNSDLLENGFKNKFSVLGHVGDGNCHFLLLFNSKDYLKAKELVDRMVERALKYEGTCTGEHGVGVGKRSYLEPELGVSAVDLMRHLKYSLDPRAILNPDKVFHIEPTENLDAMLNSGHVVQTTKCC